MRFLNPLQISLQASLLVVLISAVRKLFQRKLAPNIIYFLWVFVALRILLPFQMEFSLPLPEVFGRAGADILMPENADTVLGNVAANILPDIALPDAGLTTMPTDGAGGASAPLSGKPSFDIRKIFFGIWLTGVVLLSIYILANNINLSLTLKKRRKKKGKLENGLRLYSVRGFNCLAGVFSPAIYVDMERLKDPAVIESVIQHELQHYRAKDNFWQLVRVLCFILQWHNPFIWWAYIASKQDCELACDARTVRGMSAQERYAYSNSLLSVIECNIADRRKIMLTTYMGGNKKFMEKRIHSIMRKKRKRAVALTVLTVCVVGLAAFVSFRAGGEKKDATGTQDEVSNSAPEQADGWTAIDSEQEEEAVSVAVNLQDFYITNTGDPSNLYTVDENGVLWGCGRNQCGQLGQGTQDYDFHEEMVKIAENVIHVDYSQVGFTIYLTEEHKLYGMGNAACGALQQFDEMSHERYVNGEHETAASPVLLMENVAYARCGRTDVACLTDDGSVWIWGVLGYDFKPAESRVDYFDDTLYYFEPEPVKVLEDAVFVTGGLFNHAALLADGSVWTWGFNYSGNCGVADEAVVSRPEKVADDVVMVWTGSVKYNVDCHDISEFGGMYERGLENTIIQKQDDSYWICGANVGTEEKILPLYYEAVDYPLVCTHEFHLYEAEQNMSSKETDDAAPTEENPSGEAEDDAAAGELKVIAINAGAETESNTQLLFTADLEQNVNSNSLVGRMDSVNLAI